MGSTVTVCSQKIYTREEAKKNKEKTLLIGDAYQCIDEQAFRNNIKIRRLVLDSNVTEIRNNAFLNCTAMKSIEMPGVKVVGQGAFEGCVSLGKAEFSDPVQKLGKAAFAGCKRLREVKINSDSKVKIIYPDTFRECQNLEVIQLPEGTASIQTRAFYHCGFKNLKLPEGLKSIGDSAFLKCRRLEYIRIPSSVKRIEKWVFHGCDRMKILELTHDPEYIGDWIINRSVMVRCKKGSKVDQYCQQFGFQTEYI